MGHPIIVSQLGFPTARQLRNHVSPRGPSCFGGMVMAQCFENHGPTRERETLVCGEVAFDLLQVDGRRRFWSRFVGLFELGFGRQLSPAFATMTSLIRIFPAAVTALLHAQP